MAEQWLTASELADTFKVSAAHINGLALKGKIPHIMLGRVRRFPPDVMDTLRKCLHHATAVELVKSSRQQTRITKHLAGVSDKFADV